MSSHPRMAAGAGAASRLRSKPKTQRAIRAASQVADASVFTDNSRTEAQAFTVCRGHPRPYALDRKIDVRQTDEEQKDEISRRLHVANEIDLHQRFPKTQRAIRAASQVADASVFTDNSRTEAQAFGVRLFRAAGSGCPAIPGWLREPGPLRASGRRPPDVLAGDVARAFRGQERDGGGDLFGAAVAAHRHALAAV
jgi:hypothetical protein